MAKIALSLSGGGFRAASFHLGVLSYLHHLKTPDGATLLDHVSALSSVSGGTLTSLWVMLAKCRGEQDGAMLKCLYGYLMESDVIGRASKEFLCASNKNHSLIREMVRIYDEDIFKGATLGELMEHVCDISIDDFSANATDLTHSVQFRFQVCKAQKTERGGTSQGVIGNSRYKLPKKIASQITLAEVFAASSCFPGGFEPLFFPRDFQFSKDEKNKDYTDNAKPLGLMDGALVDNQGIEPINLVRNRRELDLFIISDADCGEGEPFYYEETNKFGNLNIHNINVAMNIAILATAQFILWVPAGFWRGLFVGITLIFLIMRVSTALVSRLLLRKYSKKVPFAFNWKNLLTISFSKYYDLISSRVSSLLHMTTNVFMNNIRSMNYATVYEDARWQNRRIMCALFELCSDKKWGKHLTNEEKELMAPSEAIFSNSELASEMGTTLWWSDDDRRQGKPEAVVSTGQYNICWNLLEFIYRLRRNDENLSPECKIIIDLQQQLEDDWKRFKANPHWMLEELKA